MDYAIIAAGDGSRLAKEGMGIPKPLVKIQGECLIDRLIRIFMDNGADRISVISNDKMPEVGAHLIALQENGLQGRPVPLNVLVKSTPSSMHSFFELSGGFQSRPFVLTTVDTVFREDEFSAYIKTLEQTLANGGDGLMGVTGYIDDESPLYVGTDERLNVTGFYDECRADSRFISGGIYGLQTNAIDTLTQCMARGESRMRNFQRALVRDGRQLKAFEFSKVMDVDHVSDVAKAEAFLASI